MITTIRELTKSQALKLWNKYKDGFEMCYDIEGCEKDEEPSTSIEEKDEFISAVEGKCDIRVYQHKSGLKIDHFKANKKEEREISKN